MHNARYSQQLQTGTGRRASLETVPPPRDRQSLGGKMSWCYGDWSQILILGISSSTLCSEQTLSAFHYNLYVFAWKSTQEQLRRPSTTITEHGSDSPGTKAAINREHTPPWSMMTNI